MANSKALTILKLTLHEAQKDLEAAKIDERVATRKLLVKQELVNKLELMIEQSENDDFDPATLWPPAK